MPNSICLPFRRLGFESLRARQTNFASIGDPEAPLGARIGEVSNESSMLIRRRTSVDDRLLDDCRGPRSTVSLAEISSTPYDSKTDRSTLHIP